MLKPETTQKEKLASTLKTNQNAIIDLFTVREQSSVVSRNNSLYTSSVMVGLAVSMGISSLPIAHAAEIEAYPTDIVQASGTVNTADGYTQQLRNDVSTMRSEHGNKSSVILNIAKPESTYPSLSSLPDNSNIGFGSEASVQINVPAPRTNSFKPVATISPTAESYVEIPVPNSSTKPEATSVSFAWPAEGTLTSRFGRRWGRMHKGIDIGGPVGTPIRAAADGVVVVSGWSNGGYGNLVEIRHSDGSTTRYGHNSRLSTVVGQTVRQGEQIAEMGSTGHSTGPHLHFEIRNGGTDAVNPMAHLPANV